ncbi:MAG: caspase family protein [Reichenbachiella sp.]|uniref:caspase family protein n=1 Tax=Reichenbachiella sp. TaxID=2184521 RepID=UPI0032652455
MWVTQHNLVRKIWGLKVNFAIGLMLFCQSLSWSQVYSEKKLALVMGNASYQYLDDLPNAKNDLLHMTATLETMGFDVLSFLDKTKEETKMSIKTFSQRVQDYDLILFYYAGHGIEMLGKNYLVPVDAYANSITDIRKNCVPASAILNSLKLAKTKINVIILDACRKNPFSQGEASQLHEGLALMDAPEGTIISFATSPGKVASDGEGQNGMFTEALLKYLPQYDLEIKDMFEQVRSYVLENSSRRQIPWESTSLTEPYILRRRPESEIEISILEGDSVLFEKEGYLHAKSNLKDVSFVWYFNGRQIGNSSNILINKTGRYQVKGISYQGQILISKPIHVSVKSFVKLQVYIEEGESISFKKSGTLHAKSNVKGIFTWLRNSKKIGEGKALSVESPGLYNLSVQTVDGRTATTSSTKVYLIEQ